MRALRKDLHVAQQPDQAHAKSLQVEHQHEEGPQVRLMRPRLHRVLQSQRTHYRA